MSKTISFFDLDHTLLKVNASFQFGVYLYRQGHVSTIKMVSLFSRYILHKCGLVSPEQLNKAACKSYFAGKCIDDVEKHVNDFLDLYLDEYLHFPMVKTMIDAHNEQQFTVILSSSPDFLVKHIAKRLGVNAWASTRYAIDFKGRISHVECPMDGHQKALHINSFCQKYRVPPENTIAYSDSYQDLLFLKQAGTAIGVNPDRKLRKYCLENNWKIL